MKYLLRNIAQSSLLRASLRFVLGGLLWLPSLWGNAAWGAVAVTMALVLTNSLLLSAYYYKSDRTSLPSSFVWTSYWLLISALPMLHTAWQAQMAMAGVLLALLVLQKRMFQHEFTEEAFLATLICCVLAPHRIALAVSVLMVWGLLILRGCMSMRVWLASIIAIMVRVILMTVLHLLGWLEVLWMEHIPTLSLITWGIWGAAQVAAIAAISLPIKRPSVASGSIYLIVMAAAIALSVWAR